MAMKSHNLSSYVTTFYCSKLYALLTDIKILRISPHSWPRTIWCQLLRQETRDLNEISFVNTPTGRSFASTWLVTGYSRTDSLSHTERHKYRLAYIQAVHGHIRIHKPTYTRTHTRFIDMPLFSSM